MNNSFELIAKIILISMIACIGAVVGMFAGAIILPIKFLDGFSSSKSSWTGPSSQTTQSERDKI